MNRALPWSATSGAGGALRTSKAARSPRPGGLSLRPYEPRCGAGAARLAAAIPVIAVPVRGAVVAAASAVPAVVVAVRGAIVACALAVPAVVRPGVAVV